jgi:S1-C subfamily serine protease
MRQLSFNFNRSEVLHRPLGANAKPFFAAATGTSLLITALLCNPHPVAAEDSDPKPATGVVQSFEQEIQNIFHRTTDSVVQVKTILAVKDALKGDVLTEALSIGTGFFVDSDGHILTAASVTRGSETAVVYWKGKAYEAKSIGQDPRTNLALLKIDARTPSLPIGNPDELRTGSLTLAVGYPADAPISAEYGFVSNADSTQMIHPFAITHIRSSVRVQPGQSGSPVLNSRGEVIGLVLMAMNDSSSTFILPINAAKKIQTDLLAHHEARHGWTGLTIEVKRTILNEAEGISIRDVYKDCPGHKAGIRPGDVLVKIGDKPIRTPADVINATFYLSIDETVNYTVARDGTQMVIPVKVVARPSDNELLALKPAYPSSGAHP